MTFPSKVPELIAKSVQLSGADCPSNLSSLDAANSSPTVVPPKRLILVGGGKGGVGKSTFARALIDYFELRNLKVAAFDGDLESASLSRFFDSAIPFASQMASGFEVLVNAMAAQLADQIVVDLGTGTQRHLVEFEREFGFARVVRDFGYTPILVWLLAPVKDSIGLLGEAVRQHSEWRIVLAKANYAEGGWALWDTSNVKKAVDACNLEVFVFPTLNAMAFSSCDNLDLRFIDLDTASLGLLSKSHVLRWFMSVCEIFDSSVTLRA